MNSRSITALALIVLAAPLACDKEEERPNPVVTGHTGPKPEVLPQMINSELPFRYPPALYSKKVQGNVTLRIFIDAHGRVAADSTRVVETSSYAALDSAAVKGSRELRFVPARRRGDAIPVSILFPVYFRHPDAPALPGDTILRPGSRQ
ncbi:MAG: energy transducer TonB [Gemmatimonadaceae bacterium]